MQIKAVSHLIAVVELRFTTATFATGGDKIDGAKTVV